MAKLATVSPVGIYHCDAEGNCNYVNGRWCELTGLTFEQALGSGWERAIHPEDRDRIHEEWKRTAEANEPFRSEYRFRRPDGTDVWVYGEVAEDRDADGKLYGLIGSVTNITELRAVREEVEKAREELEHRVRERTEKMRETAMVVEQMADAVIRSDLAGRIVSWNRGAERLFGYEPSEILGASTFRLTPEWEYATAIDLKRRVRAGESIFCLETVRVRKDGEPIDVELSVFPLRDEAGTVLGTTAIVRDITERKRAEAKMRQLSQRLLRAQDEERGRIARELHDSTAQLLAALTINMGQLLAPSRPLSDQRRQRLLAECAVFAERALMEVRTQSYLLHPPLLEERGIIAALQLYIDGFIKRSGIDVVFRPPVGLERPTKAIELAVFRIVQESLTNVHRHSGSPRAEIDIVADGEWINLEVRDFGRGLPNEVDTLTGVGIAGIRERVTELGGKFLIESASPGTRIRVRLRMEHSE